MLTREEEGMFLKACVIILQGMVLKVKSTSKRRTIKIEEEK